MCYSAHVDRCSAAYQSTYQVLCVCVCMCMYTFIVIVFEMKTIDINITDMDFFCYNLIAIIFFLSYLTVSFSFGMFLLVNFPSYFIPLNFYGYGLL
jgi:hypothetical protein